MSERCKEMSELISEWRVAVLTVTLRFLNFLDHSGKVVKGAEVLLCFVSKHGEKSEKKRA